MNFDCKKCKMFDVCEMTKELGFMNGGCRAYTEKIPLTNADHIRAMTDEELTRFFAENCGCDEWCMHKRSGACASKKENECCLDVWYRWLKAPVDKED